jgi:hypothetical protein
MTERTDAKSRTRSLLALLGVVGGVILVALAWFSVQETAREQSSPSSSAEILPPFRPSRFQNTEPAVAFVGAAGCAACHAEEHASYLATAHSKALAEVVLAQEPPDGEFDDVHSKKRYRIRRQDNQMYHQEWLQMAGEELILANFPVRYVIGSGRFSRSYLIEIDGFLYESPATWYSARPGWALSPGYDKFNPGFQRPAELRCLLCHAGRIEPVDNSPQRVDLHALAIDCERCHGPGALHVAKWKSSNGSLAPGEVDETIVNPVHLDRHLREDICAQCHLHSAATVELPGRRLQDFRPGRSLADFVTHFSNRTPSEEMQVVGHVEQMRLSPCYQESETLTCTTCHDLHAPLSSADKKVVYRAKCLTCHSEQACTAGQAERFAAGVADNCLTCHMPQSKTEIPHFAFTHHRIGIHAANRKSSSEQELSELVPLEDPSWQPKFVQDRNLGLAYLQFSIAPGQGEFSEAYRQRAQSLLEAVEQRHPGDTEVTSSLARLFWSRDPKKTLYYFYCFPY